MNELPLKERLTSRKFWLTALAVVGVVGQMALGNVDTEAGLAAIAALVTGYNVGNGLAKK